VGLFAKQGTLTVRGHGERDAGLLASRAGRCWQRVSASNTSVKNEENAKRNFLTASVFN